MASQIKPETKYESVMLVDDNEVDNFINSKILKGTLFAENILIHTSAVSAMEYLNNLEGLIPDIIFLDVDMPVNDGFSFLRDFEALPKDIRHHTKIYILTNSINPMDTERAKNSSMVTDYITKPLNEGSLASL